MTLKPAQVLKLQFLMRVIDKEARHLYFTDQRLFAIPFDLPKAQTLETDLELSERVDAFVGRFGRLQDTLGDKLLPLILTALGEIPGAVIDNLNKAERLGLIDSVEQWLALRSLRKQMVHEYVEDLTTLVDAIQTAHGFVDVLVATANRLKAEVAYRGWVN